MSAAWRPRVIGAAVALAIAVVVLVAAAPLSDGGFVDLRSGGGADSGDEVATDPDVVLRVPGAPNASEAQLRSAPATTSPPTPQGGTEAYEAIRNRQDKFSRFAAVPSAQLDLAALTEPAPVDDNGPSPQGQFRVACEYSHFGADDPIVFPGRPGASHLHMFFGNTETDAFTTQEALVDSGGSTCSGFELNRSAYWIPALLDGRGNAVVPDQIIIYYKTHHPESVTAMPQGLQMVAGNTSSESFEADQLLQWSCGANGQAYAPTNRIPDCGGDIINASVVFPNCWDGVNLASPDFTSHLTYVNDNEDCPSSHPRRLPKISILVYWPGVDSVDGWHLSSDVTGGFNAPPGGTLHADWWGGWNDETMDLWIEGCMQAARNCSYGQTGTARQLAGLNQTESYEGENLLPLPAP
jgi:hypothetical protein